jgi:hypothetical protein
MNWILAEDLAKAHHEALLRVAGSEQLARQARNDRPGIRRAIGVRLVRAGLRVAAGVRAARTAPDVVGAAMCDQAIR